MPFPTDPLDFGNRFMQQAQIKELQAKNKFAVLRNQNLQDETDQDSAINEFVASGGNPQELNQFGMAGIEAASAITELAADRTEAGAKRLQLVIDTGRAANNAIREARISNNPRQSIKASMQIPMLADVFKGFKDKDIDSMSDEEFMAALEKADIETDIFNESKPQQLSRLISGQEAENLGARPGTLLEQTTGGGKPTDTRVVQGPSSGINLTVNTGDFETASNRDLEIKRLRNITQLSGELSRSIKNTRANPYSSGLIGVGADALNRFGDVPIAGDIITSITEGVTDLSPEELARVLTQSQLLVAKLVRVVTGDDSGRYTEAEQERTIDIQAQRKFLKSSAQVLGGLSEIQAITVRGELRIRGAAAVETFTGQPLDILTDEGLNAWGDFLINEMGLSPELAIQEAVLHRTLPEIRLQQ